MSIFDNIEKAIFENKDYLKEEVFRIMKVELMREYLTPSTFKIIISEDDFKIKTVSVNDIRADIDGHHTLFTAGRYVDGKGWFKFDKESAFTLEDQVDEFLTNVKIKVDEYLKLSLVYTVIEEVMTLSEAANKWSRVEGTIRAAIKSGKFVEGIDYRKAGGTILITRCAMERVYGYMPERMETHE